MKFSRERKLFQYSMQAVGYFYYPTLHALPKLILNGHGNVRAKTIKLLEEIIEQCVWKLWQRFLG